MFENSPSGKVRFLAMGELPPPGSCFVCGSGNREEGYVDTGVWLEYIGEGLICNLCVIEIGEKIGMLIPNEAQHIQGLAESLATENTALKEKLENANERLNALDLLIGSNHAAYLAAIGVSSLDSSEDPAQPSLLSGDGESTPKESDSDNGGSFRVGKAKSSNSGTKRKTPYISL